MRTITRNLDAKSLLNLILVLLLAFPTAAFATLSSTANWNVTGSGAGASTNPGAFTPGKGAKDVTAATDLTVDATDNRLYSSATHNFVSGDVNKWFCVTAGTNWTTQCTMVVSTAANKATVSRHLTYAGNASTGTYDLYTALDLSNYPNKNASGCTSCQSTTANISTADGVTDGSATISSATGAYTSVLPGNAVYVSGGTGSITAVRKEVQSFTSTTITFEDSVGLTTGTGVTINIGGQADIATIPTIVLAGNTIWLSGSFSRTAVWTLAGSGTAGNVITWNGYGTVRGDRVPATFTKSSGTSYSLITVSGAFHALHNFIVVGGTTGSSAIGGLLLSGTSIYVENVEVQSFTTAGINLTGSRIVLKNVWAHGGNNGGANCTLGGIAMQGFGGTLTGSAAGVNACAGVYSPLSGSTSVGNVVTRTLMYNNTGTAGQGINSVGSACVDLFNNTIVGNSQDGIHLASSAADGCAIVGNLIANNTGFGINSTVGDYSTKSSAVAWDGNAYYNNTAGARSGAPIAGSDVMLTADPFTNSGALDFTLNSTAGGGALAKAAGFPGAMLVGGTGYLDIGALQSQGTGGSSSVQVSYGGIK